MSSRFMRAEEPEGLHYEGHPHSGRRRSGHLRAAGKRIRLDCGRRQFCGRWNRQHREWFVVNDLSHGDCHRSRQLRTDEVTGTRPAGFSCRSGHNWHVLSSSYRVVIQYPFPTSISLGSRIRSGVCGMC
jgi:hypothetical protein